MMRLALLPARDKSGEAILLSTSFFWSAHRALTELI
jgi:hypothetical protein